MPCQLLETLRVFGLPQEHLPFFHSLARPLVCLETEQIIALLMLVYAPQRNSSADNTHCITQAQGAQA